jgi:2-phospho-L-lactate guanylyltransferase
VTGRTVDLMVPIKSLSRAKTRLRGAADNGIGDSRAHELLIIALARDTVAAAMAADQVRQVIVITSDPEVTEVLGADGAAVLADRPEHDLNGALRHGAAALRTGLRPPGPIGVLQADLPALRPAELADALAKALSAFRVGLAQRAFCADAQGQGTTMLLVSPLVELAPRFGVGSAAAHELTGALRLVGHWPGLRRDVDHPEDLRRATEIGLGPATEAALRTTELCSADCARHGAQRLTDGLRNNPLDQPQCP